MMTGKIRDRINFISRLNVLRLINAGKVFASYHFSKITKQPQHWGNPLSIAIEPTTSCNLRCPECPSGLRAFTRPTGMLEFNLFKNFIDQVYSHTTYLTLYFQGESFLNKSFFDFVEYASSKNIYTATSTNAHFINEENAEKIIKSKLDRLIISIDGTTQEVYEQYRVGGNLEKVISGTKKLIDAKKKLNSKTPYTIFQFLVVKPNEHQVEDVKKLAKQLGVDEVKFKTAQVYDPKPKHHLIPENKKYSRYKFNGEDAIIKNNLDNSCWRLWSSCVMTWDGKIVPCCFDKDAKKQMGDLKEINFNSIWNGNEYHNFRKAILKSRKEIDICANCSEGTTVWA